MGILFLYWVIIKDGLQELSLKEYEEEWDTVYGYMVLKLGDYRLGYLEDEWYRGDIDLPYYIKRGVKCGTEMLQGNDYFFQLLDWNLLDLKIYYGKKIKIQVVHNQKNRIEFEYYISFEDLINEVQRVYKRYIEDIKNINPIILTTREMRLMDEDYKIFMEKLIHRRKK